MDDIFNPFNKEFSDVTKEDLDALKKVSEGWFVEYKRIKPEAKSLAKSISSFANSHGGVLFIGVDADDSNYAKEIIGVTDEADAISDSVKNNVQPVPYMEIHKVSIDEENHVFIITIPEGMEAPYVHSDGRIYRRNGASSDPLHENNRHAIDSLYDRSRNYHKKKLDFRINDFTFTVAESNVPYVEIFINDFYFDHKYDFNTIFSEEKLADLYEYFSNESLYEGNCKPPFFSATLN